MLTEASQKINGADKNNWTTPRVVMCFIRKPGGFPEITFRHLCGTDRSPPGATPTHSDRRLASAEASTRWWTLIELSLLGSFHSSGTLQFTVLTNLSITATRAAIGCAQPVAQ